jgi:hypothetical protein
MRGDLGAYRWGTGVLTFGCMLEKFELPSVREERELAPEETERLMIARIQEDIEKKKKPTLYTSFGIVLDAEDRPLVFERRTEPHRGLFSLIGGKIDQSYLTRALDPQQSSLSKRFSEEGLERPSYTMTRELLEELYTDQKAPEEDDIEAFEQRFAPKRVNIIFDANCNAYNMVHLIKTLPDVPFSPSSREVGAIKRLDEIDSDELNPLTRFALKQLGYVDALDEKISYGPISKMVSPQDLLLALKRKTLTPTMALHETAFLISY